MLRDWAKFRIIKEQFFDKLVSEYGELEHKIQFGNSYKRFWGIYNSTGKG